MEICELRPRRRDGMHVVTQWQGEQYHYQRTAGRAKSPNDYYKSDPYVISHRKPNTMRQNASPLVTTPPNERWDIGSIRHIRQCSDQQTPTSTVESIFEMPPGEPGEEIDSPNSSTGYDYVAELEDTSQYAPKLPLKPRRPPSPIKAAPLPSSMMEFKTSQMTARAVIKVIDETIAAIEDTNQQLLSRALAAEGAAEKLREQNCALQLKIKHYSRNQYRPKPAPLQDNVTSRPRHQSVTTPLSTFNNNLDQNQHSQRQTRSQLPPPREAPRTLSIPLSRPKHLDLAPNSVRDVGGFPLSPRTLQPSPPFVSPMFQPSPSFQNTSQTQPSLNSLSPSYPQTHQSRNQKPNPPANRDLQISPVIPGSVSHHTVSYDGAPLSYAPRGTIISLDEARRRAKPLPPLGPMSPSVVRGVVEIGKGKDDGSVDGRLDKRKRGLSGFFGRKKGGDGVY